ncbi:hypothethical protein [Ralstonia solanacearum PSI07]|nr:hypothethical protein [Ralstonia solanacearum PSI07]
MTHVIDATVGVAGSPTSWPPARWLAAKPATLDAGVNAVRAPRQVASLSVGRRRHGATGRARLRGGPIR